MCVCVYIYIYVCVHTHTPMYIYDQLGVAVDVRFSLDCAKEVSRTRSINKHIWNYL